MGDVNDQSDPVQTEGRGEPEREPGQRDGDWLEAFRLVVQALCALDAVLRGRQKTCGCGDPLYPAPSYRSGVGNWVGRRADEAHQTSDQGV